jgi:hypothetical protein
MASLSTQHHKWHNFIYFFFLLTYMGMKEINTQINGFVKNLNENLNSFVNFIGSKLKNFKNLTIGEQISYPAIGLGLILVLVSIILFII